MAPHCEWRVKSRLRQMKSCERSRPVDSWWGGLGCASFRYGAIEGLQGFAMYGKEAERLFTLVLCHLWPLIGRLGQARGFPSQAVQLGRSGAYSPGSDSQT